MMQLSTTSSGPGQHFLTQLRPYLAVLLLLLAAPLARAQAPAWQTAVTIGPATNDFNIVATAVDAGGNMYLAGSFSGTVTLGSTILTSAGQNDVLVAKWSPATSSFLWAQRAGGIEGDVALAVAVSGTNVYVTGVFNGADAIFGGTTLVNSSFGPNNYTPDAFVAKLTDAGSAGSFGWALRVGSTAVDNVNAVVANATGVYIAGNFDGPTADFGSTVLTNSSLYSHDVFVAKLADAGRTGSFTWVQRAGYVGDEFINCLSVVGPNVYVAGAFGGAQTIFGNTLLTNGGPQYSFDTFVAKLTDAGSTASFAWAQRAGGSANDDAYGLAVRGPNVYLTGSFASPTIAFGPVVLTSAGSDDAFVAKLTDAGPTSSFVWALRAGGAGTDGIGASLVNGSNVYVAGVFTGPIASVGTTTLANSAAGTGDIFVAKLTDAGSTGSFAWAQGAGGAGNDRISDLFLSSSGTLFATGYFAPPATFGAITLPVAAGKFLATLTDPTLSATAGPRVLSNVAVFPNPAHATATIQLPLVPGALAATLTILDALGRTVRTATVALPPAGLRHELDLTGLPTGFYAVRVAAGESLATCRLVVE